MKLRALFSILACPFLALAVRAGDEVSPWGVSSSSSGMSNTGEWMPKLHDAGITTARLFPEWVAIEPRKGEWTWDRTDALVRTADENHFRINAILMGSVPWSTDKPHTFPMSDLDGWSGFVSQSVARYKGRIHHWEVWNEGNGGFNSGHHTAIDYARLAAVTYAAAKKADPSAQVGLTVASFDPAYLRHAILAQKQGGAPAHFDFLAIHPYEIADGIGHPDGEIPYLWMTRLLRDVLAQSAPEKADAGIWITELGRNIARRKDQAIAEREAAAAMVKLYVMGIAQGIRCVQWFEAQDPAREEPGFGLIRRDGMPRDTYRAFKTMTTILGPAPKYLGWVALGEGGRGYGFVFQSHTTPVLVAWKAAGDDDQRLTFGSDQRLTFPEGVQVTSLGDAAIRGVSTGKPIPDGDEPVFIGHLPPSLVAQAGANRDKQFPWGGDFSKAKSVSVQLGTDAPGAGIFQTGARTAPKVTFPDGTTGILMSANQGAQFYVHPSFASIHTREYFVRITVRRVTPGNVGMNLFYENGDAQGSTPYKNAGRWFGLGNEDGWQTGTWHVKDACLAKMWGYDISFRPEQSQPFVIGKVEVSTVPF